LSDGTCPEDKSPVDKQPTCESGLPVPADGTCPEGNPLPPPEPVAPSCDPRYGVATYGCYCGEGDTCPSGLDCPPVNSLDLGCRNHDMAYAAGNCTFKTRDSPQCKGITEPADADLCLSAKERYYTVDTLNEKRIILGMQMFFCR
jgi:hypothetical protein